MPNLPFVPSQFPIPEKLETDQFRLRMLTVSDVVRDYDAVMTSAEHLKKVWPHGNWPDGLTLEQNLVDLGWHQKEFQTRRSFAYTVVALDESRVVGCVYINPTIKRGYDAEVYLWARQSEPALEERLYVSVKDWLSSAWPFQSVGYPGRSISWEAWNELADD